MNSGRIRIAVAVVVVTTLAAATYFVLGINRQANRIHAVAFFQNSNGIFTGDDVRIRGVRVGEIEKIEPEPSRVKISFWFTDNVKVPADAKAVILSPTLVTARAIQLTPPYSSGPVMGQNAEIPLTRTAVPVEWDDFRVQLQKLTAMLQPTQSGGVSTLGALIDTTAENLRGQGASIRAAIIRFSQLVSALGDHSSDIFTSAENLAKLVSALQDSTTLLRHLNSNLASVTGLLANDPDEVAGAVKDLNSVVNEVKTFVAENRETLGTTSDKLTSVSQTLNDSLDDVKQLLHVLPTTMANAVNLYQPAQGTLTGVAAVNNFADPINFICGAIQAASRLGAEQSAKLCVQYLAPIVKNRQYNFPPIGANPFVGTVARPNEITYSEDWMRPDSVPPQPNPLTSMPPSDGTPLPAEAPSATEASPPTTPLRQTDPADGLPGMMLPPKEGS